ncbi:MAG: prepilin-type N-terminal cleavage/methylation domain-containing protein [Acidimicrobiales bacterium]
MPAARAVTSDGLRSPRSPRRRRQTVGDRLREAVWGVARRWLAGGDLRRVPALVPARSPTLRGEAWIRADRRGDGGFTLVEVMVAFTVLLIALVPVASVLVNSIGQAASSREQLTALSIAEQYIELLNNSGPHLTKGQPITDATTLETPTPLQRSGVSYTVDSRFKWVPYEGSDPDLCTSGAAPRVMDLLVTVHWSHTTQEVTDSTIIDYPPSGLPTEGFLAVQVSGDPATTTPKDATSNHYAWATRVRAVPVTLRSPPAPTAATFQTTIYPDAHGCAFEQVPAGTYSATVGDPTPGTPTNTLQVGPPVTHAWAANANEAARATQTGLTVSVGQVTTTTFQYDEGSLVSLQYPTTTATEGGVTCPGAGKLLCVATGQEPTTASAPTATPLAEVSVRTTAGWSVHRLTTMSRAADTACTAARCVVVGSKVTTYTSGASVGASVSAPTTASSPTFTLDSLPSGVTSLSSVTCPPGPTCYAVGTSTTGPVVLSATVGTGALSWTPPDTLPAGTTYVSGLVCPASTACDAVAVVSGTPAILSLSGATTWKAGTLQSPPATTGLSQLACASATACFALAATGAGPEILSLSAGPSGPTWNPDPLPTGGLTLTALSLLSCPSTTSCYVAGTQNSGTATAGVLLSLGTGTAWVLDSAPATTGIYELTCAKATACVALGSTSTGPVVLTPSGTAWTVGAMPTSPTVNAVTEAGCVSATHCVAVGSATTGGQSAAVVLELGSSGVWTAATLALPSGVTPAFFSGIACTAGGSCSATGATPSSALFLDGTPTAAKWTPATPTTGLAGMYVTHVPIAVQSANLKTSNTLVLTAPATDASSIGPLFPFFAGYTVAAAECTAEVSTASTSVTSAPGGSATATLPMGLLPVAVQTAAGSPVAGASITVTLLTATGLNDPSITSGRGTCKPLHLVTGDSPPATFAGERTGPSGLSGFDVVYDTYELTVTAPDGTTASKTVQVSPTATVVTGVAAPLPTPVTVTVT